MALSMGRMGASLARYADEDTENRRRPPLQPGLLSNMPQQMPPVAADDGRKTIMPQPPQQGDPYAAIRTMNFQGADDPFDPEQVDVTGGRTLFWDSNAVPAEYRSKYSGVYQMPDGRIMMKLQQPGEHKYDTMEVVYAKDPSTGQWTMQGDPANTRQESSSRSGWGVVKDGVTAAAKFAAAAAAMYGGASLLAGGGAGAAGGGISSADAAAALGGAGEAGAAGAGAAAAEGGLGTLGTINAGAATVPALETVGTVAVPEMLATSTLPSVGGTAVAGSGLGLTMGQAGQSASAAQTAAEYGNEGRNYPTTESTQGSGGSPVNSAGAPSAWDSLRNYTGSVADWAKANPNLARGLFGVLGGAAGAMGGQQSQAPAPAPIGPPVAWNSALPTGIQEPVQRVLPQPLAIQPSGLSMGAGRFLGG